MVDSVSLFAAQVAPLGRHRGSGSEGWHRSAMPVFSVLGRWCSWSSILDLPTSTGATQVVPGGSQVEDRLREWPEVLDGCAHLSPLALGSLVNRSGGGGRGGRSICLYPFQRGQSSRPAQSVHDDHYCWWGRSDQRGRNGLESSPAVQGTWHIAAGSIARYRVKETLFGESNTAVGRTSHVTGSTLFPAPPSPRPAVWT
jgi:hypothetical protein